MSEYTQSYGQTCINCHTMIPPYSPTQSTVPSLLNLQAEIEESNIPNLPSPASAHSPVSPSPRSPLKRHIAFSHSLPNLFNLQKHEVPKDEGKDPGKLPIRERIRHFTWTWFTMTMATGGIANVMYFSLSLYTHGLPA